MGMTEREQRVLSRIAEELRRTAPVLVSLLTVFNRLVADEVMPPRRPMRRIRKRLSATTLTWGFISTWSVMTVGMITTALILSHMSHGT